MLAVRYGSRAASEAVIAGWVVAGLERRADWREGSERRIWRSWVLEVGGFQVLVDLLEV
jgi:hypothetical protein